MGAAKEAKEVVKKVLGRQFLQSINCCIWEIEEKWHRNRSHTQQYIFIYLFISPLFNQVGKLRTSSNLQLRPGQDKAKQFDTYNDTELHMG